MFFWYFYFFWLLLCHMLQLKWLYSDFFRSLRLYSNRFKGSLGINIDARSLLLLLHSMLALNWSSFWFSDSDRDWRWSWRLREVLFLFRLDRFNWALRLRCWNSFVLCFSYNMMIFLLKLFLSSVFDFLLIRHFSLFVTVWVIRWWAFCALIRLLLLSLNSFIFKGFTGGINCCSFLRLLGSFLLVLSFLFLLWLFYLFRHSVFTFIQRL